MKKTNKWMILWALLLCSTAMVSCDDDDEEDMMQEERARVEAFMLRAAQSDMFEITTGDMAEDKGEMQQVRAFGAHLVMDHTASSQRLMTLAQNEKVTLPTPMTLPADKQAIVARLSGEQGRTFDVDFANVQVTAHQEAIALYEQADKDITDPEVQAFIDQTLPVLRTHLTEAQTLRNQVTQAQPGA